MQSNKYKIALATDEKGLDAMKWTKNMVKMQSWRINVGQILWSTTLNMTSHRNISFNYGFVSLVEAVIYMDETTRALGQNDQGWNDLEPLHLQIQVTYPCYKILLVWQRIPWNSCLNFLLNKGSENIHQKKWQIPNQTITYI